MFAVGIKNSNLEKIVKLKNVPKSNGVKGSIEIPICKDIYRHINFSRCDCKEKVSINLHIADYTENYSGICSNNKIDVAEVRKMLEKYVCITDPPRMNEYPCDFEPYGWKNCGGLLTTYANTPGNTLPIIWGERDPWGEGTQGPWKPLYQRYFNPWAEGNTNISELNCGLNKKCKLLPNKWGEITINKTQKPPCKNN